MAQEKRDKKVYDYDQAKVRETLVKGFRQRKAEATTADLAGLTGLPLQQIEAELPAVADEYGARLKVTEKGEILYSFPRGMTSRYTGFGPRARSLLKALGRGAAEAGKALFKVWIVVMLVGYFVLFLALALFSLVASVAVQSGGGGRGRDDRRGGGLGGLWLTTRLFDSLVRIWFYSELFKGPESRGLGGRPRAERRPLHKAVFSHVFGDGDPNPNWATIEKKAVVAFLQTHKGLMTLPEFMAITGLEGPEAETAVNAYLLEFEGSPEVSEAGTLYFSFPRLMERAEPASAGTARPLPLKRLEAFSSNAPKADRTFRLINIVNLAFGGYFAANALSLGSAFYVLTTKGWALRRGFALVYSAAGYLLESLGAANPVSILFWGLGVVPLVFSALFFGIPILRAAALKRRNETLRTENLRRILFGRILKTKGEFRSSELVIPVDEARPADPAAAEKAAKNLAAWAGAEVSATGYDFAEIARTQDDVEALRSRIDVGTFAPGATAFDTDAKVD